jgi:hypothetical protein
MGVQTNMSQFVVCLAKYVHNIIFLSKSSNQTIAVVNNKVQ